jgi:hypothetical protein
MPDRRAVISSCSRSAWLSSVGVGELGFQRFVPIANTTLVIPTARTVGSLVFLSIVCAPVLIGRLLAQRMERTAPQRQPDRLLTPVS